MQKMMSKVIKRESMEIDDFVNKAQKQPDFRINQEIRLLDSIRIMDQYLGGFAQYGRRSS